MISIVIAAYNEEKNLEKCVAQILKTKHPFEIIIVDDGSRDNTWKICRSLEERDNRIKAIHQSNGGVASARNTGMQVVSGDWIMFADADDILSLKAIELLDAQSDDTYDIILGAQAYEGDRFEGDDEKFEESAQHLQLIALNRFKYTKNMPVSMRQIYNSVHGVYSKLFKASFVKKNNLKFLDGLGLGEDLLFFLDALECTKNVLMVNSHVYTICSNSESSTRRFNPAMIEYTKVFSDKMYDKYCAWKKENDFYSEMCYQIYFHLYAGVLRNLTENRNSIPIWKRISIIENMVNDNVFCQAIDTTYSSRKAEDSSLTKKEVMTLFMLKAHMTSVYVIVRCLLSTLRRLHR